MDKLLAFAVFDNAAQAFNRPFFVQARGMAVRSFADECRRAAADNPMYAHPQDFSLFFVGFYDERQGRLEGLEVLERVATAADYKEV